MNSFWKGVSLTIIVLLGVVIAYNLYSNGTRSSGIDRSSYDQQVETYNQHLENQSKMYSQYLDRASKEIEKAKEINEESLKNTKQFKEIIDRWETQADRFDKILSNMENRF